MANKRYAAQRKFDKLAALNAEIDAGGFAGMGARRTKKAMQDSWVKRSSANTYGFFDQKKARAIKRGAV